MRAGRLVRYVGGTATVTVPGVEKVVVVLSVVAVSGAFSQKPPSTSSTPSRRAQPWQRARMGPLSSEPARGSASAC